ncbi:hypothetical protein PTQ33_08285, partial [Campylobacter sp. 50012-21]|uniref:hypothetical protein n=1 Tax=Campylobacter magnus TaxID=3026462 RepID=UPI00235E0395
MAENFGALISEIEKLENSVLANNLKELENTLAGINDNDFRFVNGLELLTDFTIDKNCREQDGTFNAFDDEMSKIENFASKEYMVTKQKEFSQFTRYYNKYGFSRALTRNPDKIRELNSDFFYTDFEWLIKSHCKLNISDHIFDDSSFADEKVNRQAFLCISVKELPYENRIFGITKKDDFLNAVFTDESLEFTIPEDKITDEIKAQFERYKDFFASVADKVEKHLDALDDTIAKNKNDFKSFSEDDMAVVLNAMSFNNTIKKLIR